jgi:L-alanine-DL-glutamate epimerase-like enolase superfamily enzyme
MKITKIEFFRLDMPLSVPYTIAYETISQTTNIVLRLSTDKGITGWGCAAPDLEVTGETPEDVVRYITTVVMDLLRDQSPFQIARIIYLLNQLIPHARSTMAMVDMALYDILARRARVPLYQLLGGYKNKIATSITIGILPLQDTLEQADSFFKMGFTILKVKGGRDLNEDVEKLLKLREKYGQDFVLRFDANQGYTSQQAIDFVNQTRKANIEILEQPTCQSKDEMLGLVSQKVNIPVMADESIKSLADAFRLARNDLTDMVNIKIMKVGGIQEAMHINSVAKAAGLEVMTGCIDECSLGISAGLHFALSRPNIEFADLDGHLDLLKDPFVDLFTLKKGVLYPSHHPGLGKVTF